MPRAIRILEGGGFENLQYPQPPKKPQKTSSNKETCRSPNSILGNKHAHISRLIPWNFRVGEFRNKKNDQSASKGNFRKHNGSNGTAAPKFALKIGVLSQLIPVGKVSTPLPRCWECKIRSKFPSFFFQSVHLPFQICGKFAIEKFQVWALV